MPENILYNFTANEEDLVRALRNLQRHLRGLPKQKEVRVNLRQKLDQARAELKEYQAELEAIRDETVDVKVKTNIRNLLSETAKIQAFLAAIPDEKVLTLKQRGNLLSGLIQAEGRLQKVQGRLESLGHAADNVSMDRAEQHTFSFTRALGRLLLALRRLPSLTAGSAIAITSTLIPAVLAAIAAVGGLIGALGGLAAALVGALGPAIGLASAVMNRFNAILQTRQTLLSAQNALTRRSASETQRLAQAEERTRNAANAVKNARQGLVTAQRNYAQAVQDTRQEIQDAAQAEADAMRAVQDAARALAEATVDAFREMEDAAERVRDAILSIQDARLNLEGARLSVREARLELRQFAQQAGLSEDAFADLMRKFEDVDVDTSSLQRAVQEAFSAEGAGAGSEEARIRFERLVLRLKEAKLQEKQATDQLSDSEREHGRAVEENNEFLREGIAASESYRAAQQALADAQRTAARASAEHNRLVAQGISQNPRVIAAAEGVRDAQEQVTEALRDQRAVRDQNAAALADEVSGFALFEEQLRDLSAAELRAFDALMLLQAGIRQTFGPATDAVMRGFVDSVRNLAPLMDALRGRMTEIGEVWAENMRLFTARVGFDAATGALDVFLAAARDLSAEAGRIFRDLYSMIVNIGTAAMPLVLERARRIADAFAGWTEGTRNVEGMRDALTPMFETLDLVVGIVVQLVRALVNGFRAASEPINDFIGWIRDGIKAFADWAGSAEGAEEIREFFEDTLPFAKAFIGTLVRIARIWLKTFQIILPIIKPLKDILNFLLDRVLDLLELIDFIIGPFKEWIGLLIGARAALFLVMKVGGLLLTVIRGFPAALGLLLNFLRSFAGWFVTPFRKAFVEVAKVFRAAAPRLRAVASRIVGAIGAAWGFVRQRLIGPVASGVRAVISFIRSVLGGAVGIVRGIARGIGRAFGAVVGFIANVVRRVRGWIGLFTGVFAAIGQTVAEHMKAAFHLFKAGINLFIRGLNVVIDAINSIPDISVGVPGLGKVKVGIPEIGRIPELAAGGVTVGATSAIVGERGPEAILPLTNRVFRQLAEEIVAAMSGGVVGTRAAVAGASRGGMVIENQQIVLPPPPQGGVPDARHAAAMMAQELRRRGG